MFLSARVKVSVGRKSLSQPWPAFRSLLTTNLQGSPIQKNIHELEGHILDFKMEARQQRKAEQRM